MVIFVLFAFEIHAAQAPQRKRTFNPLIHKVIEYALPFESGPIASNADYTKLRGQTSLGETTTSSSPGEMLGTTYYDLQHINTTGRMVGIGQNISGADTNVYVHFTWMNGPTPISAGRTASYVHAGVGSGAISGISQLTQAPSVGGFFNLVVTSNNQAIISGHFTADGNFSKYAPTVWYDSAALAANFKYVSPVPENIWMYANPWVGEEAVTIWPHLGFQNMPDGSHVTHLTGVTQSSGSGPYILYYYRKHGITSDLSKGELSSCPMLDVTGWDCPWVYDTAWATVALVTASKQSGKVALTWTANLPDYSLTPGCDTCSVNENLGALRNQYENDVYFQTSDNYGVTWNPMKNVTHNNAATANWMPYNDIDAMWDDDDDLHIAWVASDWKRYRENGFIYYDARIYHWTEMFGNSPIFVNAASSRVVAIRNYDPIMCNAGAFNLNLAKPQLAECNNKLYCLFVDLWDGHNDDPNNPDCSHRGYTGDYTGSVNGELMVSISDDNGIAFDLAHNLTNTPTPDCDSVGGVAGPCASDHWPSMPPHGFAITAADGTISGATVIPGQVSYPNVPGTEWLPIMYINDIDPGPSQYDNTSLRDNPVRFFYMACVDPDHIGCCRDNRGDLNGDGSDCNILDLTFSVYYIFRSGMTPTCLGEADINADGSPCDILDLTFMVDRIFRGGISPYSCGEAPCNTAGCH